MASFTVWIQIILLLLDGFESRVSIAYLPIHQHLFVLLLLGSNSVEVDWSIHDSAPIGAVNLAYRILFLRSIHEQIRFAFS